MIDWHDIDTLFLDMDGTLLDLRYDNYFWNQYLPRRYAQIHAVEQARADEVLTHHYTAMRGKLEWYCVDYWSETLNLDIVDLKQEVTSLIRYRDHAESFLDHLAGLSCSKVIVTNAHPTIVELKDRHTGLCDRVDRVICSLQLGYPKEHPEFWPALQEIYTFDPARTLLIDDNHDVLDAANAYGVAHLLGIARPDSGQEVTAAGRFRSIADFRHLIRD